MNCWFVKAWASGIAHLGFDDEDFFATEGDGECAGRGAECGDAGATFLLVLNSSPSSQSPAADLAVECLVGVESSLSRNGDPMRRGGMGGSSGRTWRRVL